MIDIITLTIDNFFNGNKTTIHPVLIKTGADLILVDCGYTDSFTKIESEMARFSLLPNDISQIIITHHDHDHMGGLKEILRQNPAIKIWCSKGEAPYLTGRKKYLRLRQAEQIHDSLEEKDKQWSLDFCAYLSSIPPIDQSSLIEAEIKYEGLEIIDTKGHTEGHVSIYIPEKQALIAGDALIVENGNLAIPFPQYASNLKDAINSVNRLLDYDIRQIFCYHGGLYNRSIKKSLVELVNSHALRDLL